MTSHIRRCPDDFTYTLQSSCPLCGGPTGTPHPASYSPEDRYGRYRRIAREWKK
jgi:H/ACA ribonucleoprotein complex subunit 3